MTKHLVLVLTEPTQGQSAEFDRYYEQEHIDDVLRTTGWSWGQRFHLADQVGVKCPLPYLALYETDTDDAQSIIKKMNDTRGDRTQSKALNKRTAGVWVFGATGPEHVYP